MSQFVLITGWARNEKSYQKLVNSCPPNSSIKIFPHTNFDLDNFEEKFSQFLKQNNINQINLIGHSLGGALAIKIANKFPEKIAKLYLVDSEGIFVKEVMSKQILNMTLNHKSFAKRKLKENLISTLRLLSHPKLYTKAAKFAYSADLQNEAREIKVPTTILWGENDLVTPLEQGKRLNELIKYSKIVVLQKMDHDWILHNPVEFWSNI